MRKTLIILGLGSNVGGRVSHLKKAVEAISAIAEAVRQSPIYESQALLAEGAPDEWNMPFLNF